MQVRIQWRRILFLFLFGLIALTACRYGTGDSEIRYLPVSEAAQSEDQGEEAGREAAAEETRTQEIMVYVCGRVNRPGVYRFCEEARVCEAIEAAGGFAPDAGTDALNLAQRMQDGQKIYVPAVSEESFFAVSDADDGRISINTATKEELMQLPGIGEAKAEAIVAYREANGFFEKPEDIMLVPGIKEAAYTKMKDRITADR